MSIKTRFESLLEAVPDALVGMDQEGVIRFVNRQTESLFGYNRDELIGQPIETLVPEPLWQIYVQHRETYFADPRTRSSGLDVELSGRHRDGTEFPANISLSHIDTGRVLLVITAVGDVTRQKLAVKNAELIAAIVQYSDDAIIGSTPEGVITTWNPAAERMYGYSPMEIIGKSAKILAPHDRGGEMYAVLARVKDGEAVEHLELNHVRKDGTVIPVSITVAPIRDEDGVIVGSSAVARDVSEQRQAFETAQRMSAIVQYSDDAIIGSTLEGIITNWNKAAERLYGYTDEEMIGRPASLLAPEDRAGEMHANLTRIRAGQHVDHLETIRIRKDGTVFPVSLTVSPICDADGAVVGASAITRNMTELRHAAQYARSLIEAGLDPLMTISPEGKITDVNDATTKITGAPREVLIGTDFSHYFTDPDKANECHKQAFSQGSVTDYPLTLRHQDGTHTDVLYNASVYRDEGGDVLGVLAVARDITQQKEAFEAAQRMAAIVEYSDDAIIGSTLDGIITSWNPAAERLYGYSRDKIVGRSVDLLSPKDRTGEIKAILAKISAGQPINNFETICAREGTTTFPVKLTVAPIRGTDGAVVGASSIAHEVTDRMWPAKGS
jgi:PAS domain S-box-containing protein